MSSKKDFSNLSQADLLIGKKEEIEKKEVEEGTPENPEILKELKTGKVPKGYKVNPLYIETKSQRVQILARPSTMQQIKKIAKKNKISMNELINRILEEYIEEIGE